MIQKCDSCMEIRPNCVTAMVDGIYFKSVCGNCLGKNEDIISSNAAGYERRRGYEDNAQDTIQPYDANGANPEFLRLYPAQAHKVFNKDTIENLKRKI
jgi:hypothetical protein